MKYLIILLFAVACYGNVFATDFSTLVDCGDRKYVCGDGSDCILSSEICDFVPHCQDHSDELNLELCKAVQERRKDFCRDGQIHCKKIPADRWVYDPSKYCVSIEMFCKDEFCIDDNRGHICDRLKGNKLKAFPLQEDPVDEQFRAVLKKFTNSLNDINKANCSQCPTFYKPYNDKCISVLSSVKLKWTAAKKFCESTSGQLAVVSSTEELKSLQSFLETSASDRSTAPTKKEPGDKVAKDNYWIGGKYQKSNGSTWMWIDGSNVEMGFPFWSVFSGSDDDGYCSYDAERRFRPLKDHKFGYCLSMLEENYYFFSEELCRRKYSPVCFAAKRF